MGQKHLIHIHSQVGTLHISANHVAVCLLGFTINNKVSDEWIKKMWHIYTMEYYSAIKRNKIGSFVETWMDLETVVQSEVSQKEKNKYRILTHICGT